MCLGPHIFGTFMLPHPSAQKSSQALLLPRCPTRTSPPPQLPLHWFCSWTSAMDLELRKEGRSIRQCGRGTGRSRRGWGRNYLFCRALVFASKSEASVQNWKLASKLAQNSAPVAPLRPQRLWSPPWSIWNST